MSKSNALAGLIGNYGDSDDEVEDGAANTARGVDAGAYRAAMPHNTGAQVAAGDVSAAIHPAPIPHCPWSACYDETSGFTYYWNQQTNAVTWEAPPEYLLALKLAQQQLQSAGSEVSAEEWQLYQQALAEKQHSQYTTAKPTAKFESKQDKPKEKDSKSAAKNKKRHSYVSDEEDIKIELITSYYHSDSESNDETECPVKSSVQAKPQTQVTKNPHKKQKTKQTPVEYGPPLPPNQSYTVPIGPELPPNLHNEKPKSPEIKMEIVKDEVNKSPKVNDTEVNKDEKSLLMELKDKAKILENLGGEIPSDLQKLIGDDSKSVTSSPKVENKDQMDSPNNNQGGDKSTSGTNTPVVLMDTNIDDLLEEIEKKELPKAKKGKILCGANDDESRKLNETSGKNSPRSVGDNTPPREEIKPLFPSIKAIIDEKSSLFPSAVNIQENGIDKSVEKPKSPNVTEKKTNVYLMDTNESIGNPSRKKLRISNSVLPAKKTSELPSYTTKYSTHIEGFSTERTGLGFSKDEDEEESPKNTVSYGKGLTFTKGEILNEDKKDEALDEMTELVEAKLKYLNQLQPCTVTPVQEMLIQMQTLVGAFRFGGLSASYWRRWAAAAAQALAAHEAAAAPSGWTCVFQRSEGRYQYVRADGLAQWEYPAPQTTDMDISTTPPHPSQDVKDEVPLNPPLPESPPAAAPPPPPPPSACWPRARVATPPPPAWSDPPPPGTDDPPPLPPEQPKKEITDELQSFYDDIAELEKQTEPVVAAASPEPALEPAPEPAPTPVHAPPATPAPVSAPAGAAAQAQAEKAHATDRDGKTKKKSKVKISSSLGIKHKSVSTLVAKWQQVADEIRSD